MSEHSKEQAQAQVASIVESMQAYWDAEEDDRQEEMREQAESLALSVESRTPWMQAGMPKDEWEASEYRIVLCTGGPHVEIVGDLHWSGEPADATVRHLDWGESGEVLPFTDGEERDDVLAFCQLFFFGE